MILRIVVIGYVGLWAISLLIQPSASFGALAGGVSSPIASPGSLTES